MAAVALVLSYLIGSIPFGVIVARSRGIDIRAHGSGNIGASNVMRVLGVRLGVLVLALDVAKGCCAVSLSRWLVHGGGEALATWVAAGAAVLVIVGHDWSIFLGFKGGKGVASSLGAGLGLAWPAAVIALCVWIAVVAATRYISLGSMIAVATFPLLCALFRAPWQFIVVGVIFAALSVLRHRDNIARLRAGVEHKIGERVAVNPEARGERREGRR